MTPENAQTIAIKALTWIVAQDDLRDVFMGASGVGQDDLRTRLTDPEFQISVLDFLCNDDQWVIGFCDTEGLVYTDPMMARQALPGGAQVNWT